MYYDVKFMVDGIIPQRKSFIYYREALHFYERIGNKARYIVSVDFDGKETVIVRKQLPKPFDFNTVKDIMSIPCMRKINGKKAIAVHDSWAYVQFADGMITYRYDNACKVWRKYEEVICTNF